MSTVYFDVEGEENTTEALTLGFERAMALDIGVLAVASTRGGSGFTALRLSRELGFTGRVIVVGEHYGYHRPDGQEMMSETIERLRAEGAEVVFGTHALSGVERSYRFRHGGISTLEIMSEVLRRFSRGVKTAVEISVMLADAGAVSVDRDLVAAGGSGGGIDSVIVLRPASSNRFFDLKVREFIAYPRARMSEVAERVIRLYQTSEYNEVSLANAAGCSVASVQRFVREFEAVRAGFARGASLEEVCREIQRGRNTVTMYVELEQNLDERT